MSIFQFGGGGGSSAADMIVLDYLPSDNLLLGESFQTATWVDIAPNQPFSVDPEAAFIECVVSGIVLCGGISAGGYILGQVVIDSAGIPVTCPLAANVGPETSGNYVNALVGACSVAVLGVGAGLHTIKAQLLSSTSNYAICRPNSYAPWEWFRIQVIERF